MNQNTLYEPAFEHDNCGIGAVVNIYGKKSHAIVADALSIVENLEHRAGKDATGETGDGVGILTQIPHDFFKKVCPKLNINIGAERSYGVGMFFFPQEELKRSQAKKMFEIIVKKQGFTFLGWRDVVVDDGVLNTRIHRSTGIRRRRAAVDVAVVDDAAGHASAASRTTARDGAVADDAYSCTVPHIR